MIIEDQKLFWSYWEASVLFPPLTPRQVQLRLLAAGLPPAGKRPNQGRGRSPLVFEADRVVDILAA